MNRFRILFIGLFLTFLSSWLGLAVVPYLKMHRLQPVQDPMSGDIVPPPMSGLAQRGARVYAENGCVYCHTQQIRGESQGYDIARGWGKRRTVPRDYVYEPTAFLGSIRIGPDLSDLASRRNPEEWSLSRYHKHLFNPRSENPNSTMPSYAYLYKERTIKGEKSDLAIEVGQAPGKEVLPSPDAEALVAYLMSLKKGYSLPEAPVIEKK